ncbi:MAG: 23S rRNA (uracil(1939)-C(5))-methyltransferase RlmD [Clostridia bacterium]|nr:23S rRNA (uracil(1939)-C(5))-methyltransferase RlmD [Clostridia bacterium]
MQKNCVYEGLVEGLGSEGEGIIKYDGTTAFVPFCLVGERVEFKALKVSGNIAYGKLEKLKSTACSRVNPPCPVFEKCGGCALQHMNYEAQLEFKRRSVKSTLFKIGGIQTEVENTVACEREYRYRNKLALPIGQADGKTVCGFYGLRSHRIVPITDCLIQSEWIQKVIGSVIKFSEERKIPAYDEQTKKGILRRIVVREIGGKFIFALVVSKDINADFLIKELEKSFKDFTFLINVNPSEGNAIFSKEWRICRGSGVFDAEECGIKYRAGANTFVQVNDDVRAKLYARVLEEADEEAVALDLYSGGGLLTAMLAKKCALAYGVEVVEEASQCADGLKEANGLQGKMINVCGKVEEKIEWVFAQTEGKKRIIVCDPPRKGMERSAVKAIANSGADKIILISCNPATLARDLGILTGSLEEIGGALYKMGGENGKYAVQYIIPFDMFPQTKHVETLVVLSHKKPDGHINVKVEFGEEEGQVSLKEVAKRAEERKPKEKVTYKKIQDYIEKIYGFKVHTAYIAEVKRDLGLPMYDAPNAVEKLKRPRAHPTPKMVEAIKETLKHFEIIV